MLMSVVGQPARVFGTPVHEYNYIHPSGHGDRVTDAILAGWLFSYDTH